MIMNANELRIGNFLTHIKSGKPIQFKSFAGLCNAAINSQDYHPIPLTEDILLKSEFKKHKGATRTGCMFCGFGCQFKDDNRLQLVHDLYPKAYEMFMNYENNGVTYRTALRKVLQINGLYLPDEKLF